MATLEDLQNLIAQKDPGSMAYLEDLDNYFELWVGGISPTQDKILISRGSNLNSVIQEAYDFVSTLTISLKENEN